MMQGAAKQQVWHAFQRHSSVPVDDPTIQTRRIGAAGFMSALEELARSGVCWGLPRADLGLLFAAAVKHHAEVTGEHLSPCRAGNPLPHAKKRVPWTAFAEIVASYALLPAVPAAMSDGVLPPASTSRGVRGEDDDDEGEGEGSGSPSGQCEAASSPSLRHQHRRRRNSSGGGGRRAGSWSKPRSLGRIDDDDDDLTPPRNNNSGSNVTPVSRTRDRDDEERAYASDDGDAHGDGYGYRRHRDDEHGWRRGSAAAVLADPTPRALDDVPSPTPSTTAVGGGARWATRGHGDDAITPAAYNHDAHSQPDGFDHHQPQPHGAPPPPPHAVDPTTSYKVTPFLDLSRAAPAAPLAGPSHRDDHQRQPEAALSSVASLRPPPPAPVATSPCHPHCDRRELHHDRQRSIERQRRIVGPGGGAAPAHSRPASGRATPTPTPTTTAPSFPPRPGTSHPPPPPPLQTARATGGGSSHQVGLNGGLGSRFSGGGPRHGPGAFGAGGSTPARVQGSFSVPCTPSASSPPRRPARSPAASRSAHTRAAGFRDSVVSAPASRNATPIPSQQQPSSSLSSNPQQHRATGRSSGPGATNALRPSPTDVPAAHEEEAESKRYSHPPPLQPVVDAAAAASPGRGDYDDYDDDDACNGMSPQATSPSAQQQPPPAAPPSPEASPSPPQASTIPGRNAALLREREIAQARERWHARLEREQEAAAASKQAEAAASQMEEPPSASGTAAAPQRGMWWTQAHHTPAALSSSVSPPRRVPSHDTPAVSRRSPSAARDGEKLPLEQDTTSHSSRPSSGSVTTSGVRAVPAAPSSSARHHSPVSSSRPASGRASPHQPGKPPAVSPAALRQVHSRLATPSTLSSRAPTPSGGGGEHARHRVPRPATGTPCDDEVTQAFAAAPSATQGYSITSSRATTPVGGSGAHRPAPPSERSDRVASRPVTPTSRPVVAAATTTPGPSVGAAAPGHRTGGLAERPPARQQLDTAATKAPPPRKPTRHESTSPGPSANNNQRRSTTPTFRSGKLGPRGTPRPERIRVLDAPRFRPGGTPVPTGSSHVTNSSGGGGGARVSCIRL